MFTTDRSNETQTTDPNASTQSSSRWSFWGQENFTQCEIKILVAWNAAGAELVEHARGGTPGLAPGCHSIKI